MPLDPGKSREAFSRNVATEMNAGKPQKQAVAIAYATQRRDACMEKLDACAKRMDAIDGRMQTYEYGAASQRVADRADAVGERWEVKVEANGHHTIFFVQASSEEEAKSKGRARALERGGKISAKPAPLHLSARQRGDANATPAELQAIRDFLAAGGNVAKLPPGQAQGAVLGRGHEIEEVRQRPERRPDAEEEKPKPRSSTTAGILRGVGRYNEHAAKEREAIAKHFPGADKGPVRII